MSLLSRLFLSWLDKRPVISDKKLLEIADFEIPAGFDRVNGHLPTELDREFAALTLRGGIRTAKLTQLNHARHYIFTDCTHPVQQAVLPADYIIAWRYLEPEKTMQYEKSKDTDRGR